MRSKFDQQLALLNDELTQMGETCAKAIGLAAQALENQDAATAARPFSRSMESPLTLRA